MRLIQFIAIFLAALIPINGLAQSKGIAIGDEAVSRFLGALREIQEPNAEDALTAVDKNQPRFIFVPGFLGSRLSIEREGSDEPVDIWGGSAGFLANTDLRMTDETVITQPLDSLDAIVTKVDVYGEALANLASKSIHSDLLTVYSYDWRQDNASSAAGLQVWLCENRSKYDGHDVYFLTHSMGGLVAEYWYKNFREMDCATQERTDNSNWMNVAEIIMVGAPLYGAPSAISAFASGANLTPDDFFGSIMRPFDQASAELTEHGATFPSLYQLLPIYRDSCFRPPISTGAALFLRANDQSTSQIDSLFSPETWKSLGWPFRIPDYFTREAYYADFLPEVLSSARSFQCTLANFDLGANVPVTYFYGILPELSTVAALEVKKLGEVTEVASSCTAAANNCMSQGDGTVPAFIAKNEFGASRLRARSTVYPHKDLMKSLEVAEYISTILTTSAVEAVAEVASTSPDQFKFVVELASANGVLFPMASGRPGPPAAAPLATDINLEVLKNLGIGSDQISLFALQSSDSTSISQWTDLLSAMPNPDQPTVFRNLNRAGSIALSVGDYAAALDSWDAAISVAGALPQPSVASDLGEIYVHRGNAWAAMADPSAALLDYQQALSLGNEAGRAAIEMLKSNDQSPFMLNMIAPAP